MLFRSQNDIVPETLRIMKRLGVLIHPEALAIWEPAVASALPMLTAAEWTDCVRFIEHVLAAVKARTPELQESDAGDIEGVPAAEGVGRDLKAGH